MVKNKKHPKIESELSSVSITKLSSSERDAVSFLKTKHNEKTACRAIKKELQLIFFKSLNLK